MAKAKTVRTPEEQAKIDARMAKVRAARQNKKSENKTAPTDQTVTAPPVPAPNEQPAEEPVEQPAPRQDTQDGDPDIRVLMAQIQEMKDMQWALMRDKLLEEKARRDGGLPADTAHDVLQARVSGGQLTGTYIKYALSASLYPDPRERLADEPKLARYAFNLNYELRFEVKETKYTTIDGIRTVEPKFELTLIKVVMDQDTGEPTNGRYDICRLVFFEDPDTAVIMARDMGLEIPETTDGEAAFLNEMRYMRMRDWLFDCFYPVKMSNSNNKREMVIDGRVVNYYEVNAEEGKESRIDFSKLPRVRF